VTTSFGMHVRFAADPGQGDALAAILPSETDALRTVDVCLLYIRQSIARS
jgi:hypothetical protein